MVLERKQNKKFAKDREIHGDSNVQDTAMSNTVLVMDSGGRMVMSQGH